MMKRSWIRQLFARPVRRTLRNAPHRVRLVLEALEDRCVPSTFTVVLTTDSGGPSGQMVTATSGDLRYCITQANSPGGDNTIQFDPTVFATSQTITLTGGQLELSDTTGTETITGSAAGVTISGNNASRVLQIDAGVTAPVCFAIPICKSRSAGANRKRPTLRGPTNTAAISRRQLPFWKPATKKWKPNDKPRKRLGSGSWHRLRSWPSPGSSG